MRLQRYLLHLDPQLFQQPEALAERICPLVAQSDKQQELFYTIFQQWWQDEIQVKATPKSPSSLLYRILSISIPSVLLLGIIGGYFLLKPKPLPPKAQYFVESCTNKAQRATFKNESDTSLNFVWYFGDGQKDSLNPEVLHSYAEAGYYTTMLIVDNGFQRDTLEKEIYVKARDEIPAKFDFDIIGDDQYRFIPREQTDDLAYEWKFGDGASSTEAVPEHTYTTDESTLFVDLRVYEKADAQALCAVNESITLERGINIHPLASIAPIYDDSTGETVWTLWGRWAFAGLFLIPLSLFFLYDRRREEQAKMKARAAAQALEDSLPIALGTEPPFEVPFPDQDFLISPGPDIYKLAKALRQRRMSDRVSLDVVASVHASTQRAGMPQLRYSSESMAAEYLVLIDQKGASDQQARLFEQLMHLLRAEEVPIETFHFHGDPRYCYAIGNPEPIPLTGLYKRFPKHRLLIFGTGDSLMDSFSPGLEDWVREELGLWEEKAWLSPVPAGQWGGREKVLHQEFILLPADISTQLDMVEALAAEEQPDFSLLRRRMRRQKGQEALPPGLDFYDVAKLEAWLGDAHFRWLAATAVYPRPYWELTLAMGKALGILSDDQALPEPSYRSLLKLSRIPWLQDGHLPAPLRTELMASLSYEDEQIARETLQDLLGKAPTSPASFVHQERESQRIINEARLYPEHEDKQKALLALQEKGLLDPVMDAFVHKESERRRLAEKQKAKEAKVGKTPKYISVLASGVFYLIVLGIAYFALGDIEPSPYWERIGLVDTEVDSAAYYNEYGIQLIEGGNFIRAKTTFHDAIVANHDIYPSSFNDSTSWIWAFEVYPPAMYNSLLAEYHLGKFAYEQKDFSTAIQHFSYSVGVLGVPAADSTNQWYSRERKDSTLLNYMHALALSYYYDGQLDSAKLWVYDIFAKDTVFNLSDPLVKMLMQDIGRGRLTSSASPDSLDEVGDFLFTQAKSSYENAQYTKALQYASDYIVKFPNGTHIHEMRYIRAQIFIQQKNYALALADLQKVYNNTNPFQAAAYFATAEVYRAQGKISTAIAALKRLRSLRGSTDAERTRAQKLIDELTGLIPGGLSQQVGTSVDTASADFRFAIALGDLAMGRYEAVIPQFTAYIDSFQNGPRYFEAFIRRANAYEKLDRKQEAVQDYQTAKEGLAQACSDLKSSLSIRASACILLAEARYGLGETFQVKGILESLLVEEIQTGFPEIYAEANAVLEKIKAKELADQIPLPRMVRIPGGTFWMGSRDDDKEAEAKEKPIHQVRVSDFFMAETEVTNAQFVVFLNAKGNQEEEGETWYREDNSDSRIRQVKGSYEVEAGYENHPVVYVTWYGAKAYIAWLNEVKPNGLSGWKLPSEAEWEYAAAGGLKGLDEAGFKRYRYSGSDNLGEVAWYAENTQELKPVRQLKPNSAMLYDMSGNVWEWCEDDWHDDYQGAPTDGGAWISTKRGDSRLVRGGAWVNSYVNYFRPACRLNLSPDDRTLDLGFRLSRYSAR